jgi:hypothetical protein
LFPDLIGQEVVNILKKAQDETDKIWKKIDEEFAKFKITSKIASQMQRKFETEFKSYCM